MNFTKIKQIIATGLAIIAVGMLSATLISVNNKFNDIWELSTLFKEEVIDKKRAPSIVFLMGRRRLLWIW